MKKCIAECGCGQNRKSSENIFKLKFARFALGAILLIAGILLDGVFTANKYFTLAIFLIDYFCLGIDIVFYAIRNIFRGKFFDENFLMTVATVGAFLIGEYAEGLAVMLFYQVGELCQELALKKAKNSVAKLMDIRPDVANFKRGDEVVKVSPDTLKIGDLILVKPGERIPIDGIVVDGEAFVDTAALTGEPVPKSVHIGDTVLSGSISQNGLLTIKVKNTFDNSTVSKIIDLVENATEKKASTEKFITKFAKFYTPVVVFLAVLIAIIPPLALNGIWSVWINRGLIFLVVSCPCALVISIPLGFFGGIGGLAKMGVLVKGGNFLEILEKLEIVVFDKTGTLTKGVFSVTELEEANGYTKEELLKFAAYAEVFSNHPIATSILNTYGVKIDEDKVRDYSEITGRGISVRVFGKKVLVGNKRLMIEKDISFTETSTAGTKVYVAADGVFVGCITIADEIKKTAKNAIETLMTKGIKKTVMLTGDNAEIAETISKQIGITETHSGLLPQDKVKILETLKLSNKGKIAFVGDGINDAPALALADVGIAMGGLGSDIAIDVADVVLMHDELGKISAAMDMAKFTKRIVWQNILFSLGVKIIFLILGAFGAATMWAAVFADVGVALFAILNSLRGVHKKTRR